MTSLLALDTSTEACSVALLHQDELTERFEIMPRLHARKLLPMINELLAASEVTLTCLDAVAFTRGPGSFTGLRIAASVAQGLAYGADLGVLPVSTLEAMAQGAHRQYSSKAVLTVLDARMKEVYWAKYRFDGQSSILPAEEYLSLPFQVSELADTGQDWIGVGSGWKLREQLPTALYQSMMRIEEDFYPQARDVATLAMQAYSIGQTVAPGQAVPVYMRGESAWKRMDQQ